jgi:5-methylcytosine-specific restriction enzyme A
VPYKRRLKPAATRVELLKETSDRKNSMEPFIISVTEEEIKREKLKAQELRKSQWWKRKRAEGVCYFCGTKVPPKELTMEHVVPIIRGGTTSKGNLVPACKECNSKKKYLLPIEWDEYLQKLDRDSRS